MSLGNINIQPYITTTTTILTSFKVTCRNVNLFNDATFIVDSFNQNGDLVNRQVLNITNEQYLAWKNDDQYIIDLIASILGYTIISSTGVEAIINSTP